VTFRNCKIERTNLFDCSLKNVAFENSSFSNLRFINCQFENVNFSYSGKEKYKKYAHIFDPALPLKISKIIFSKGPQKDFVVDFGLISPSQMDERTIKSLKEFIAKNELVADKDFLADKWLMEKLWS
jgi:hypothetical protein